jgi:hypothetical protein
MSRVLEETGQPVRSTDLYDRCFGEAGVDFLMSRSRADTDNPPSRLWVFSERITFYPAGVKPKGGGTTGRRRAGLNRIKMVRAGLQSEVQLEHPKLRLRLPSAGGLTAELKASERRESSSHNRRCRRESNDHPRLRGSVHYESFDWR